MTTLVKPGVFPVVYISGDATLISYAIGYIEVDAAAPVEITLQPLASALNGYYLYIHNNGPSSVDVYPSGTDQSTGTIPTSLIAGVSIMLLADVLNGTWVLTFDTTAAGTTGTVTSVNNVGVGAALVLPPFTTTPTIKSLIAGTNIGFVAGANEITINSTAPDRLDELTDVSIVAPVNGQALTYSGGLWVNSTVFNSISNIGTGATLVVNGSAPNPTVKSLVAGNGIFMTAAANTITIGNSGVVNLLTDNNTVVAPVADQIKISGSTTNSRSGILTELGSAANIMQVYNQRDVSPYVVSSTAAPYNTKMNNAYNTISAAYAAAVADGFGVVVGGNNITPINILVAPGYYNESTTLTLKGGINIIATGGPGTAIVSNLVVNLNTDGITVVDGIDFVLNVGANFASSATTGAQRTYFQRCSWTTASLANIVTFNITHAGTFVALYGCTFVSQNSSITSGVITLDNNAILQVIDTTYNNGIPDVANFFIWGNATFSGTPTITNCTFYGAIRNNGTNHGWIINNTISVAGNPFIFSVGGAGTLLLATSSITGVQMLSGALSVIDCILGSVSLASASVVVSTIFNCQITTLFTIASATSVLVEGSRISPAINIQSTASSYFMNSYITSPTITLLNKTAAATTANVFINCRITGIIRPHNGSGTALTNSCFNTVLGCSLTGNPCFDFSFVNTTSDYAILNVIECAIQAPNEILTAIAPGGNHQISFLSCTITAVPNVAIGLVDIQSSGVVLNMTGCTLIPTTSSPVLLYTNTVKVATTNTTNISECSVRQLYIKNMYSTYTLNITNSTLGTGGLDGNEANTSSTYVISAASCTMTTCFIKAGNSSTGTWTISNSVITSANSTSLVGLTPTSIIANIFNSTITNGWDASNASTFIPGTAFTISMFNCIIGATTIDGSEAGIQRTSIVFNDVVFTNTFLFRFTNTTSVSIIANPIAMAYCTSTVGIPTITLNSTQNINMLCTLFGCGFITPTTGSTYAFVLNNPGTAGAILAYLADCTISRMSSSGNVILRGDTCSFIGADVGATANSHTIAAISGGNNQNNRWTFNNCMFSIGRTANSITSDIINVATTLSKVFTCTNCDFIIDLDTGNNAGSCINLVNIGARTDTNVFDGCTFSSNATSSIMFIGFNNATLAGATQAGLFLLSGCVMRNTNAGAVNIINLASSTTTAGVRYKQLTLENTVLNLTADTTAAAATTGLVQFTTQAFISVIKLVASCSRQNIFTLTTAGASTTETGIWINGCNITSNFNATPRLISWNSTTVPTTATARLMQNIFDIGAASALMTLPALSTVGIANIASNILIQSNTTVGITLTAVGTSF